MTIEGEAETPLPQQITRQGLSLRALVPNAITAAALCCGLTGIRFAIGGDWERAVGAVILAGFLDGIDGRVARMMKAQSRFGAELDSLADSISFGVAPALILFLWSLNDLPRFGWIAAMALAVCCALRLARFNAQIDVDEQPHKSAGFLTGVPAPLGAGLAFLPMYIWAATDLALARNPIVVSIWIVAVALLMISNIATYSWGSLRLRRHIRLEALAIAGITFGALLTEPAITLAAISVIYLLMLPLSIAGYAKVRRARANPQSA